MFLARRRLDTVLLCFWWTSTLLVANLVAPGHFLVHHTRKGYLSAISYFNRRFISASGQISARQERSVLAFKEAILAKACRVSSVAKGASF